MSTAVAHRRALYGHNRNAAWQAYLEGELPEGYRRVEYIESTGVQWIDTGVYVNQDTDVEIDYCNVKRSSAYSVFGVNPLFVFTTLTATTDVRFKYNNNIYENQIAQTTRALRRMDGRIVSVNREVKYTFPATTFEANYTALLFARRTNDGAVEEKSASKVWSCRIDNARNLIPCVRVADSKPGMYDLCGSICGLTNSPFYINAGSGADFTYGEL